MSQGHRIPLGQARCLAQKIICELRPYCQRIKVAGSIRRRQATVGDMELVIIPLYHESLLPGVPGQSLLDPVLLSWVETGRLIRANRGETLKKFYIPALHQNGNLFKLEICISSPERWGVEMAIKTGPAEFSHKLVTRREMGGYLPSDCSIGDGWQVRRNGEVVPFTTEREFVEFCLGKWIPPQNRTN